MGDDPEYDSHSTSKAEVPAHASSAPTKRIFYTTTRPDDYITPYSKLLDNEVTFGAPDKRSVKLINSLSVSILHLTLLSSRVSPILFI